MLEIHDNEIVSYNVDLKAQKITLFTLSRDTSTQILAIFEDVMAHKFEIQLSGSILFEIEKKQVESFVSENYNDLKIYKNHGWPICYETFEDLNEILLKERYSYYIISSSYGLGGWILAKNFTLKKADNND